MYKHILAVLIVAGVSVHARTFCPSSANEGDSYTFTHTANLTQTSSWTYMFEEKSIRNVTVAICYTADLNCTSPYDPVKYESSINLLQNGSYVIELTVNNITRSTDETNWAWFEGSEYVKHCYLQVYAFDTAPQCSAMRLTRVKTSLELEWGCLVLDVYPMVECLFEFKQDNEAYVPIRGSSTDSSAASGTPPYHRWVNCTMRQPVNGWLPGGYTFKVTIYPNVSQPNSTISKTVVTSFRLELPKLELANCPSGTTIPHGFIKQGDEATCECRIGDPWLYAEEIKWIDSRNNTLMYHGMVDRLLLRINSSRNDADTELSYTCIAKSGLHGNASIKYTPRFAYGPSRVTFGYDRDSSKEIGTSSITYTVHCSVQQSDVSPNATVTMQTGYVDKVEYLGGHLVNGSWRHEYKITTKKNALASLTCVATNSLFPELNAENAKSVGMLVVEKEVKEEENGLPKVGIALMSLFGGILLTTACFVVGYCVCKKRLGKENASNESSDTKGGGSPPDVGEAETIYHDAIRMDQVKRSEKTGRTAGANTIPSSNPLRNGSPETSEYLTVSDSPKPKHSVYANERVFGGEENNELNVYQNY